MHVKSTALTGLEVYYAYAVKFVLGGTEHQVAAPNGEVAHGCLAFVLAVKHADLACNSVVGYDREVTAVAQHGVTHLVVHLAFIEVQSLVYLYRVCC